MAQLLQLLDARLLLHSEIQPDVRVNGVAPAGIANSQLRGPRSLGLETQKQSAAFRNLTFTPALATSAR